MTKVTHRVPDNIAADTRAFCAEVEKFLSGEVSAAAFRGVTAPMGIYEQRNAGAYMVRVRGAAGVFLPHQARAIADLSEAYGNGVVHVTTRQNMQIHGVCVEDTPAILERLLQVGLFSRGSGGNTVRSISACPSAGACAEEVFDVTPYALALTEYLIRQASSFNLPRKFKASFSGCRKDCGLCSVADLGFFAHERGSVRGFAVYAGGGMGAHSALAIRIEDFVPAKDMFEVAEAVKRLFDRHGDRSNRSKARLRFVAQRLGPDGFRQAYREELELVRSQQLRFPAVSAREREPDAFALEVRLALGDVAACRLSALADIASNLSDGALRATQEQNLQIRGVTGSEADDARRAVRAIDESLLPPKSIRVIACAGASVCKMGRCVSRGLAEAIEDELRDMSLPFEATIRISGCANSCGHHPIAPLGFYGSMSRVDGRMVPFYTIMAGGHLAEGNAVLAEPIGRVPARALPALLRRFWAAAIEHWRDGESLADLMTTWGTGCLTELARDYERVPPYEEAPEYYQDFEYRADLALMNTT